MTPDVAVIRAAYAVADSEPGALMALNSAVAEHRRVAAKRALVYRPDGRLHPRGVHILGRPVALLDALLERAPDCVPVQALCERVWGAPASPSLGTTVYQLRAALREANSPARVITVYGIGYRLELTTDSVATGSPAFTDRDGKREAPAAVSTAGASRTLSAVSA